MNKKILFYVTVIATVMLLTTSSCKDNKQKTADAETTTEKVDSAEDKTQTPVVEDAETEQDVETEQDTETEDHALTYERPKGKVLELLQNYNAHMEDYNTTDVEALGMGFQGNRVLVNFSVTDISFNLKNKAKLKSQARELIEAMPISEKVAWRCIPNEKHELMMTFVGRQSRKIVSIVFTQEELKDILF